MHVGRLRRMAEHHHAGVVHTVVDLRDALVFLVEGVHDIVGGAGGYVPG